MFENLLALTHNVSRLKLSDTLTATDQPVDVNSRSSCELTSSPSLVCAGLWPANGRRAEPCHGRGPCHGWGGRATAPRQANGRRLSSDHAPTDQRAAMRGENTSFEMLYEESTSSKIRAPGEHRCIFEIVNATQCKSMQVNVRTERQGGVRLPTLRSLYVRVTRYKPRIVVSSDDDAPEASLVPPQLMARW